MSEPKNLPGTMTILAYLAAGSALTCSYLMMYGVFKLQSGIGSDLLGYLLPAAVLFSGATLWRLSGHLHRRGMKGALSVVVASAVLLEGGSIATSYMSANISIEQRRIDDRQASSAHQAAEQASQAASIAAARLAQNISDMPSNYRTLGNKTATQLQGLLDSQRALLDSQSAAANQGSAVSIVIDRKMQNWWALMIALALSISVLAVQFGLGATSDAEQSRRHGFQNVENERGESSGQKNAPGLRSVK